MCFILLNARVKNPPFWDLDTKNFIGRENTKTKKKTICALSHLKTPMLQAPSGRLSVHSIDLLSGVTEQQYVLIFFTRLWSVGKPLLFDTQNPRIPGFLIAHAYKYKTKRQAKMKKKDSRKMIFLLISHQATLALEKYRFAHRP